MDNLISSYINDTSSKFNIIFEKSECNYRFIDFLPRQITCKELYQKEDFLGTVYYVNDVKLEEDDTKLLDVFRTHKVTYHERNFYLIKMVCPGMKSYPDVESTCLQ